MGRKYEIVVLSKGAFARTLRIYCPKKADRAVIMHDGQNVFYDRDSAFGKSWRALDMLKQAGAKNTAIIGIDNFGPTREDDYMPFKNELSEYGIPPSGGKADVYMDFIQKTVMPYLDKRFDFDKYAMMGSSAGALATLYYASRGDGRFVAYGLISTPLFVSPKAFDKFLTKFEPRPSDYYRLYIGGNETEMGAPYEDLVPDLYVKDACKLITTLRDKGIKRLDFNLNSRGVHDEISWRPPERDFFKVFSKM